MRVSSIALFGLLLTCGTAPEPALARSVATANRLSAIPADFHGKWRESLAQCGDLTETGLDISANRLKYYAYTVAIKSIRQKGPKAVVVTYEVQKDELGGARYSQDWEISYDLGADGRTLIETGTDRDRTTRIRCEKSSAINATPRAAQIAIDSLIGDWEDGGPACASIRRGRTNTSVVFRGWYCEAGEQSATPITLERLGDRVFAHQATDLSVVVHSNRTMNVDAGPRSQKRFGDGLYVTDAGLFYNKKAGPREVSAQPVPSTRLPQLRIGAYVVAGTPCGRASNATLAWWNGQFFSAGRQHPAYPDPAGENRYIASTRGWEDNKVYRIPITVRNKTEYERDGVKFSYCTEASLPPTWRDSTPPQKKLSSGPAMVEASNGAATGDMAGRRVTVQVTGPANLRNAPTTRGSKILATFHVATIGGVWVSGQDGNRWLKVDLAEVEHMDVHANKYGYIAAINLREIRR